MPVVVAIGAGTTGLDATFAAGDDGTAAAHDLFLPARGWAG
jgi:hypothetical protein